MASMDSEDRPADAGIRQREIRSYVLRAGRLTRAQERALSELWPRFGVPAATPDDARPDLDALFGRRAPRILEIGIGNGAALLSMAAAAPDRDWLGAEVHAPGVGHCLLEIERLGLGNVRLFMEDAVGVLRDRLQDRSLAGLHLFFPDPWHKKRHHKRRLVQPPFVELMARKLADAGYFHVATDWPPYAEHIAAVLEASGHFGAGIDPATGGGSDSGRPLTRFEARGQRLGHPIWERIYPRRTA
jgi:tRNA (guanine-N7-)-methyltransferase